MECLGSGYNDAYFMGLAVQIHQVMTKVRSYNLLILHPRFDVIWRLIY